MNYIQCFYLLYAWTHVSFFLLPSSHVFAALVGEILGVGYPDKFPLDDSSSEKSGPRVGIAQSQREMVLVE